MATRTAQQPLIAVAAPSRFTNIGALTRPRDPREIAATRAGAGDAALRQYHREVARLLPTTMAIVVVLLGAIGLPFVVTLVLASALVLQPDDVATVFPMFAVMLVATAVLWFTLGRWMVRILKREWGWRGNWEHRWRLGAFAADNQLRYMPRGGNLPRVGNILVGIRAKYWDVFYSAIGERGIAFGNARSNMTASHTWAPAGWSFLAVKLDTQVPHMYLRPRTRGKWYTSPLIVFRADQRMSLEGEFDRHFTLYAPKEYERDALYVITPDLMALLIDELPGSHVETFGDTLVVTTPRPMRFEHLDSWARMSRLLDTVVPKTLRQTRNYQDHRSEVTGEVASRGRRMRFGIPIVSVIAFVFLVLRLVYFFNHLPS